MWQGLFLVLLSATLLISKDASAQIPGCDFFDTVSLTGIAKFPNGSYPYEKIIIPAELTGEYDYEILMDGEKVPVPKHLRGCACKLGTCIRFCCHRNQFLVENERTCIGDIAEAVAYDPYVNITLHDNSEARRHVLQDFIVQQDLPVPCSGHFHLDAVNDEDSGWTLFEDGRLVTHFDGSSLSKQEYCLQPHPITDDDNQTLVRLVPHACAQLPPNQGIFNTLRVLTIICLIPTIFIYLWLPKLRNIHGYCFVCYMICLVVGYALILADAWKGNVSKTSCQTIGYLGYFFVMAGFIWLTIISFDMWNSFRVNNYSLYTPKYRFIIYSCFAWGIATVLTIIVIVLDNILDDDDENQILWMPGVALYNCWVKTNDWSTVLYFHGPIALQIIFNITMFVLTARRIVEVKRELQSVAIRDVREKKVNSDRRTYILFLRLFIIMGVVWTFEIFSFLGQHHKVLAKVVLIFDYINCAQGVIIFIMFVLKSSVLKLIANRIRGIETSDDTSDSEEEIALNETNGGAKHIGPNILN